MPLPLPRLDLLDLQKLELDLLKLELDLLDLLLLLVMDLLESLLDVPLDCLLLDLPLDFSGLQVSTPCPEEVRESLEQPELLPHLLTSWTGV